jgi:hypothetical protein
MSKNIVMAAVAVTAFAALAQSVHADSPKRVYYEKLLGGSLVSITSHADQDENSLVQLLDFLIETKSGRHVEVMRVTLDGAYNVLSEYFLPSLARPYKMMSAPPPVMEAKKSNCRRSCRRACRGKPRRCYVVCYMTCTTMQ